MRNDERGAATRRRTASRAARSTYHGIWPDVKDDEPCTSYLLCWRYLRTRYIALASIISVMLGVATMIVVNSVMAGFAHEMQDRIHGILSDIVFEARGSRAFPIPIGTCSRSATHRRRPDRRHDADGPSCRRCSAFTVTANAITRQVMLIGIDERTHSQVGDFGKYLQHPENRKQL